MSLRNLENFSNFSSKYHPKVWNSTHLGNMISEIKYFPIAWPKKKRPTKDKRLQNEYLSTKKWEQWDWCLPIKKKNIGMAPRKTTAQKQKVWRKHISTLKLYLHFFGNWRKPSLPPNPFQFCNSFLFSISCCFCCCIFSFQSSQWFLARISCCSHYIFTTNSNWLDLSSKLKAS